MDVTADRVIAVVGLGAVLPDARNVAEFWSNVKQGRYSISDVPAGRWDPALYYDPDPKAPDKSYSRIGGWVQCADWDPVKWRLPIPPRVSDAMDWTQKWAIGCTLQALQDYGYPSRPLDAERTAIILGNAMGGERHYQTALRTAFPEYARELQTVPAFSSLSPSTREAIVRDWHERIDHLLPPITEDTMPGELSNCIAGRLANLLNFRGPNFVTDAACASAMAAISAAVEGLIERRFDAVITGGIDRNMGASTFIKFCKIGALSATGSRPYADGADGFVMGEGAALFLMKRLSDAERDGDRIYAVLRGVGGSSDGKGKGITAPNPVGQKLAIARAWENAALSPSGVGLIEGHGTSTAVGDLAEVESLIEVFGKAGCKARSVGLGSVKSNIGHLKSAAGAAGVLKTVLALHEKVLPPSCNFHKPNPGVDFNTAPFQVITELRPWEVANGSPRQAGVSAFGFGGTNFHVVLEEHVPGRFVSKGRTQIGFEPTPPTTDKSNDAPSRSDSGSRAGTGKAPLRGALLIGAATEQGLAERLRTVVAKAKAGEVPPPLAPVAEDLQARERLSIDYGSAAELVEKAEKALKAFSTPALWKALRAQGVFRGAGPRGKVAFLYTGQGSQYLNMLRALRDVEPIVVDTFAEADGHTVPLLGRPISEFLFIDPDDKAAMARAEEELRQTAITQPAVLTVDIALTRLLGAYGIAPDMVMGHSLGEYGALVACGAMPFRDALEAVSARGREMTRVSMADNGWMVAVFAPLGEIERIVRTVQGNVVIANINSKSQAVIGGASAPVEQALKMFQEAGYTAMRLPVSHAFHTSIVAPASEPMRRQLQRLHLEPPHIPIVSNVTGDFYPMGTGVVPQMVELLAKQIASPVQFIKGLQTLFDAGARLFVETGPKKALQGFADETFADKADVLALFTNHPKFDDRVAFNQALCGAYAMGHGAARPAERPIAVVSQAADSRRTEQTMASAMPTPPQPVPGAAPALSPDQFLEIGKVFASAVERGLNVLLSSAAGQQVEPSVVVTGASLGLPGTPRVFGDDNIERMLNGEVLIKAIPDKFRQAMADKRITRLVKSDTGIPRFEMIDNASEVVKLAGRPGELDLAGEFGVPGDRLPALDSVTRLAIGAGLDALRDAGIPLVQHYKTTTKGTKLPDRWGLPEALRDETGVIFTSAFPGMDSYTEILTGYFRDHERREQLRLLEELRALMNGTAPELREAIERRKQQIVAELEKDPYVFDRRFLLRVLAMGHSQFAELIGARGPNTQINSACASSTMAFGLAEDWIKRGRCKRVVVIGSDNITSDNLVEWFGAGFLASGAAATDEKVEEAALPFDRRRHGLIVGMGAAGVVIERADVVRERGLQPICEVVQTVTANSAFHGTRLDVEHITGVMETLVKEAEARTGVSRHQMAEHLLFVSHETYTPARGGSASAEVMALRKVFGSSVDKVVVANTKGYTGHPMAVGIEDVVAIKSLETGIVPAVANYREVDPELGRLNLSHGGEYPVEWAMRLAAGFGSQISMSIMRWTPMPTRVRPRPNSLGYATRIVDQAAWSQWLQQISGMPAAELEVSQRTLRIKANGQVDQRPIGVPAVTGRPDVPKEVSVQPTAIVTVASEATRTERVESPSPAAVAVASDPVRDKILALAVEKTGYPAEMLDLELDLEADLGIDTVKQAELLANVRGVYDIPRDENLKLRDFPTLGHVIKFVYAKRPDLAASPVVRKSGSPEVRESMTPTAGLPDQRPIEAPAATGRPDDVTDPVKEKLVALVVEKTGYPADMLDLELDLEADLGIDTVKQAELMATVRGIYNIPRDENLKLRDFPTLNHVIKFVYAKRPDLRAESRPEVRKSGSPAVDEPKVSSHPAPTAGLPDQRPIEAPAATGRPDDVTDPVKEKLVALVVEKTDYPADMLDLELDLEADLGIDTVKQAELMATVRGIYNIPRDENLKLRDFPTLGHVINFVYAKRPDLRAESRPEVRKSGSPEVDEPKVSSHPAPTAGLPDQRPIEAPAATGRPDDVTDPVKEKLVALVVEKTGYPADMLDLELDLEADLGIDTVKQAELMATVRGIYNIPRDENLKLRDFPTLGHVINFVYAKRPDLRADAEVRESGSPEVRESMPPTAGLPDQRPIETSVATGRPDDVTVKRPEPMSFDAANRIPRRAPAPVMRPPLDFCKATGVTFEKGRRVIVMADQSGAGETLATQLSAGGIIPLVIGEALPDQAFDALLDDWLSAGPISGVYWLAALDREQSVAEMTTEAWREAVRSRVKLLYRTMRRLYEHMDNENAFLVAATRCGGQHGYGEDGSLSMLAGGVSGFVKAFKRERPKATVKVVDFAYENADDLAMLLVDETLRDPGVVEIGYQKGVRWTIGLMEQPAADGQPGLVLSKDSVFIVTGAAGSIVSAIVGDLAAASGGVFYLFDRVPEPDPDNADLKRFATDRDGLKLDLAARLKARGERVTPMLVERELAAIERSYAALQAVQAVEAAGGLAVYASIDLTDAEAVNAAVDTVRDQNGRVDVLVHAAGIEISRFLPDKEPAEFERVFDVKTMGWFNLLKAIGDMPLDSAVVFSSIAGRFGNGGQTDYSAANDLLCKSVLNFRKTRPATRGIAVDWTAWSGIGMASRGSIPKMMQLAGIDMLPPEAGIPIVRRELTEGGTCGEVVIAGALGIMLQESDPVGVDVEAIAVRNRMRTAGPMIGRIVRMTPLGGLVVETSIDPTVQPFLFDHQIDGTPVLPGVMGVEAFAELAALTAPGFRVVAVEDVQFHAAFKFFRNQPRTVRLEAVFTPEGDEIVAQCRLIGSRHVPTQTEPQDTVHFTGRVRLAAKSVEPEMSQPPMQASDKMAGAGDIYRVYFHGPAYQVVESAWRHGNQVIGRFAKDLPPAHVPDDRPTAIVPRLIELCEQTAGLWDLGLNGVMALPERIESVSAFETSEPADKTLFAVVRPDVDSHSFDADVVDEEGRLYVRLRGYRTVQVPGGFDTSDLDPLKVAMAGDAASVTSVGVRLS